MLVLIIGGRYGASSKEDEAKARDNPDEYIQRIRSITNREVDAAREHDIPVFCFIEASVHAEFETYRANRGNDSVRYVHVDDPRIFEMVEDIMKRPTNNFVRAFSKQEDIVSWLSSAA